MTKAVETDKTKTIALPEEISVRALASLLQVDPTAVIGKLIANGVMATINQNIDYDTAALLVEEFGLIAATETNASQVQKVSTSKNAVTRPPIVTIMGHVDHGKTSLLDYIRRSNVAASESGGITQHISAYQIDYKSSDGGKRKITFIDTPGHEAFSALRAHGAALTDIVILVVAADDGVKPQTVEAINHAKTANVKIIVAINKTDLPGANLERVKQQLSEQNLVSEEWGGQVVMLPVSAKTGAGVNELLEMVVLTADLMELRADPEAQPEGIVIEANLDKQIGPLATVLVYNGTIHPGQTVVVGKTYGRIRALEDDLGHKVPSAGPAKPVRLIGLKDVPSFGDRLEVVPSEKIARTMTQNGKQAQAITSSTDQNTYKVILKADVGGSLAALEDSLAKLKFKGATIEIISSGIGQLTENDLSLAKTTSAAIISFRLKPLKRLTDLAEKDGVTIKEYWIIYDAIEFLQSELKRIAIPVMVTVETGRLKVLAVFSRQKSVAIVGGEVTQGEIEPGGNITIYRNKEEIGTAKAGGLKIGKLEAKKVTESEQCGVSVTEESVPIEQGDILAFSVMKEE